MLRQRVITAAVMLALMLPALFASTAWPFAVLSLLVFSTASWEWGRLNGAGAFAVAMGVVLAAACGYAFWAGWSLDPPRIVWWLVMFVWVIGGAFALRGGPQAWPKVIEGLRWVFGMALLWTAWLAIVNARTIGINFILSVFCLVWAADIAAYFGGRAFGKRKLAPAISPGKSWEGVWSGMAGAVLLAGLWLWLLDRSFQMDSPSIYIHLQDRFGWSGLILVVLFLSAMGVVGDLFESLVKRSAGAKDSSGLLPGHGGVLDRVDALLPVFPIALAMMSF